MTVFGCGLEASSTETKGTVLIRNADDLLNYNKGEEKLMEDIVKYVPPYMPHGLALDKGREGIGCLGDLVRMLCDLASLSTFWGRPPWCPGPSGEMQFSCVRRARIEGPSVSGLLRTGRSRKAGARWW